MEIPYILRQPLLEGSRVDPDSPALHFGGDTSLTYRELADRVAQLAVGLKKSGVRPGDRVAIIMYNKLEYWLAYFAITRISAIAVRLNFRLTGDELEYAINDSGSSVLIADPALLERIDDRRDRLTAYRYISTDREASRERYERLDELFEDGSSIDEIPLPSGSDSAMIMYTSGTTGQPKGALWSHANSMWFGAMQLAEWGFTADTVIFVAGPMYHVGALEDYSLPTLLAGGQVVFLESGGFNIRAALEIAVQRKVTDLTLFPSMINEMLQLPDLDSFDLGSMRRLFTGGDPLQTWAVEAFAEKFPGVDIVQVYGLTEGTPIAVCNAPGAAFRDPSQVGRALPLAEVSVRGDDGEILGDGEIGEVWTRSPANANVYWGKPVETAATFVDGWCRTGDLGRLDHGSLSITGRKKDMIRSGGENIYAREVEDVLMRHDRVVDVAVIAVPDSKYGESVAAVLIVDSDDEAEQDKLSESLRSYCSDRLAGYKRPKHYIYVSELPRTPSQKIQKFLLRDRYAHLGS